MSRKGRKAFSGSALVEYLTKEGCENALHAHPEYRGKILHVEKSHMSINDQVRIENVVNMCIYTTL